MGTAIFVEKAVVASQPDREELILEQRRKTLKDVEELKRICEALDIHGTGKVDHDAFMDAMQNDLMVAYMGSVGLEVHDVELFFAILVESTEVTHGVDIERFVEGCMAMKGNATSLDLQRQLYETRRLYNHMTEMEQTLMDKVDMLI